jgi:hypothetical protein
VAWHHDGAAKGPKPDSPTPCVGEVIFLVVLSACLWRASG